jgi:hypothetical protein
MKTIFSTGEAARLLGVQPYRIEYALATGRIKEPNRVFGKRAYRWPELVALAEHFGVELSSKAPDGPEMEKR